MTREQARTALLRLTHAWAAASGTTAAELALARRAIARALLGDQPEALVNDQTIPAPADVDIGIVAAVTAAIDEAAADLAAQPGAVPARVFVRPAPIATHHDPASVPEWGAGRAIAGTLGPFRDRREQHWWVDSYEAVSHVAFARGADDLPVLLVPVESSFRSLERMDLTGGTVWISAQALAATAPSGYVGLRIAGGTLELDGPTQGSSPIRLDPQGSVSLTLDLDVPNRSGPGGTRPTLPSQASIRVTPGGVETVDIAGATLELDAGVYTLMRTDELPRYEPALGAIAIPCAADQQELPGTSPPQALYVLGSAARIEGAAWTLPVTHANADALGEAAGVGGLALALQSGLTAQWLGLEGGPLRLRRAFLEAAPGLLSIVAPAAENRRARIPVPLWTESDGSRRASIETRFDQRHRVTLLSDHLGTHLVMAPVAVVAHLDRPLHASGARTNFRHASAHLRWIGDGETTRLYASAVLPPEVGAAAVARPVASVAIPNGLFRTTPAQALFFGGTLDGDGAAASGVLVLGFGLYGVLPTLPDPYAANVEAFSGPVRDLPLAALLAVVRWPEPSAPELSLASAPPDGLDREHLLGLLPRPLRQAPPRRDDPELNRLRGVFDDASGATSSEDVRLLDLSSNADLLGVGFGGRPSRVRAEPNLSIRRLDLVAPGINVRVFLLPQVSWEPVITPQPPPEPFPGKIYSADDGGPSVIAALSMRLVPVAPLPVAGEILEALGGGATGAALFTLPFGITAVAELPGPREGAEPPLARLRQRRPSFGSLTSARIFSIEGRVAEGSGIPLPGAAFQLLNATERLGVERFSVLGQGLQSTRHTFNATFGPGGARQGVPVSRVDLSGYGESARSSWSDNGPVTGPKITKARFDVLVGRTAYEVVQEMSVCWPWQAVFVRTITMERRGHARIIRTDSGWEQAAPGVFRLPGFPDVFHPGPFKGFYNITAIREFGAIVRPTGAPGTAYQPVRFNADAAFEHVVAGQRASGLDGNGEPVQFVPLQGVVGYVQRLPLAPLAPAQLAALFASQGPIGAALDCEIDVGRSGLRMRVSGVEADAAAPGEFAVATRGMPKLPAVGQWSVSRTDNEADGAEQNEPQPVDRTAAVPLIRKGLATLANASNGEPYRFAGPADLHSGTPRFDYGFLFATEVFRLLFLRPRIDVDAAHVGRKQIAFGLRPLLADPYAVITSESVFPKAAQCLRFPTAPDLDILPGGHLRLTPTTFKVEPRRVREQVKTSSWRMALEYADPTGAQLTTVNVTLDTTATPPATLKMSPLNTVVDRFPFTSLMRIAGGLEAKSPGIFTDAEVVLGSVLAPVETIITVLRDLHLPLPLVAVMVASDDKSWAWKQNVHIDLVKLLGHLLKLEETGGRINLGFCKFRGEIKTGAFLSFAGKQRAGVFLEIEGEFQQQILAVGGFGLYGGGYFGLELSFELEEETVEGRKTSKEKTTIELAAAAAGSLGGDLIPNADPDIIEAEVNVRYGYLLELDVSAAPPKIKPGVLVGMEVAAEILEGCFGIGFEWEGKALMTRHEEKIEIKAEVTAAANVTLAWAIEETIEIEGEFETEVDEKVVAGLLVALGLVPV